MSSIVLQPTVLFNLFGRKGIDHQLFSRITIENDGRPLTDFVDNGVTISQLIKIGYTKQELITNGITLAHLRKKGNMPANMANIGDIALSWGWTLQDMGANNIKMAELRLFGITLNGLRANGLTISAIVQCDQISFEEWAAYGLTLDDLRRMGANSNHFKAMGWNFVQMMQTFQVEKTVLDKFRAAAPMSPPSLDDSFMPREPAQHHGGPPVQAATGFCNSAPPQMHQYQQQMQQYVMQQQQQQQQQQIPPQQQAAQTSQPSANPLDNIQWKMPDLT